MNINLDPFEEGFLIGIISKDHVEEQDELQKKIIKRILDKVIKAVELERELEAKKEMEVKTKNDVT